MKLMDVLLDISFILNILNIKSTVVYTHWWIFQSPGYTTHGAALKITLHWCIKKDTLQSCVVVNSYITYEGGMQNIPGTRMWRDKDGTAIWNSSALFSMPEELVQNWIMLYNNAPAHNAPEHTALPIERLFNQKQCAYRFTSTVFPRSHPMRLLFVPEIKNETEHKKG